MLHFDGRHFADDFTAGTADTWLLRRVRPTLEGTLNGIFDYRFTPDFAGGRTIILDAYLAARLRPWAVVTAGKFKVPVGLERLVSATDLRFIERGLPTSMVPNRDLGVQLSGELAGGALSYSLGYFNGVSDGASSDANTPNADAENDTRGDWAARVFLHPFASSDNFALRGLGFGIAGAPTSTRPAAPRPRCCQAIARRDSKLSFPIAARRRPPAVRSRTADASAGPRRRTRDRDAVAERQ